MSEFVIRYSSRSTVNGKDVGDVYVLACPDLGRGVFSYTKGPDQATRWDENAARYELSRCRWPNARMVAVEEAVSL